MKREFINLVLFILLSFEISSCRSLNQSSTKADLTILDGNDSSKSETITFEIETNTKKEALRIYGRGTVGDGDVKIFQLDSNKNEIPVSFKATVHENSSIKLSYKFFLEPVLDVNTGLQVPGQYYLMTRHPHRWKEQVFKNISGSNYVGMIKDSYPVKICFEDDSCEAEIDLDSKPVSIRIKYFATDISDYGTGRPTFVSGHRVGMKLNFNLLLDKKNPSVITPVFFGVFANKFMKIENDAVASINGENFMSDAFKESELNALNKLDQLLGSLKLVVKFLEGERAQHTAFSRKDFNQEFKLKKEYEVDFSN